jgi:hypothetical protein
MKWTFDGRVALVLACAVVVVGCDARSPTIENVSGAIVYGADDRTEAYLSGAAQTLASSSIVALVRRSYVVSTGQGTRITAPSLGAAENLCPGERFAEQPAAAFCSGVLVDWDLVLTAGHCTRLFGLDDFVVVFGYQYRGPNQLEELEVVDVSSIVVEELDPPNSLPRRDYAWLRLARPASSRRSPVAFRAASSPLTRDEPLVSIGAGGGIPIKVDAGGRVVDERGPIFDYFVADTDTAHGSSGGGAFDQEFALVGVLARGASDFVWTDDWCSVAAHADSVEAAEEFTFAYLAVNGLCDSAVGAASSLCRPSCGSPCAALPREPVPDGGCRLVANGDSEAGPWVLPIVVVVISRARRSTRRPKPRTCKRAGDPRSPALRSCDCLSEA